MSNSDKQVGVLIFAKAPRAGQVKTRLCTLFTPQEAMLLAGAMFKDTLEAAYRSGLSVQVALSGEVQDRSLKRMLKGSRVVDQGEGTFSERMERAFKEKGGVLIGMDTPQVAPEDLVKAAKLQEAGFTPFGETLDGGWWLLGLNSKDAWRCRDVPASTSQTSSLQAANLDPYQVRTLNVLQDVDTPEDAKAVAAMLPNSHFGEIYYDILNGKGNG